VKKQISATPVIAIGLVIVLAVVWFALIAPKQARSGALDEKIAELEVTLATAEREARPATAENPPSVDIDVADVFRLAKAMPDREDMPGMILELDAIALSTGVSFVSIQPGAAVAKGAYYTVPVTLTFEGNYYDLTDFLFRMRSLVSVRDGVLEANGRLYTLDGIAFHESEKGFPQIQAVLTVSAFAFGTPPATGATAAAAAAGTQPGAPAPETTATSTAPTGTTAATTSPTTTTPTPPPTEGPPADPTGDGDPQAAGGGTD
jgi:Tfp pilus assembly protein PilO